MLIIAGLVVLLLLFNDEISLTLNMKYDREISELNRQIKESRDSADYFRKERDAILHENSDLERIAREQFHMQRPTEDVYIIN